MYTLLYKFQIYKIKQINKTNKNVYIAGYWVPRSRDEYLGAN